MVSFFGLKIGGGGGGGGSAGGSDKKKKKNTKQLKISAPRPGKIDEQEVFDERELSGLTGAHYAQYSASAYSLSRPDSRQSTAATAAAGRAHRAAAPYAAGKNLAALSMTNLPSPHKFRDSSYSILSLKQCASNPNLRSDRKNSSSPSLNLASPVSVEPVPPVEPVPCLDGLRLDIPDFDSITPDGPRLESPFHDPDELHLGEELQEALTIAQSDPQRLSPVPRSPLGEYELRLDLPSNTSSWFDELDDGERLSSASLTQWMKQWEAPIIQNVQARRDTLASRASRRRSLMMQVEKEEALARPKTSSGHDSREIERIEPLRLDSRPLFTPDLDLDLDLGDGPLMSAPFLADERPLSRSWSAPFTMDERPLSSTSIYNRLRAAPASNAPAANTTTTTTGEENHRTQRAEDEDGSSSSRNGQHLSHDDSSTLDDRAASPESLTLSRPESPVMPLTGPLASPRFPTSESSSSLLTRRSRTTDDAKADATSAAAPAPAPAFLLLDTATRRGGEENGDLSAAQAPPLSPPPTGPLPPPPPSAPAPAPAPDAAASAANWPLPLPSTTTSLAARRGAAAAAAGSAPLDLNLDLDLTLEPPPRVTATLVATPRTASPTFRSFSRPWTPSSRETKKTDLSLPQRSSTSPSPLPSPLAAGGLRPPPPPRSATTTEMTMGDGGSGGGGDGGLRSPTFGGLEVGARGEGAVVGGFI
ncbi:hypothetical protein GGR56DRAFT_674392 [Xylariaceae sp. FL0804]|nr:hypothetical protein GGR56DRAFT_674392 [Xylariaceae sp. FL0804]